MPKIHLLSEELINKIAAGEVIERPASIVKELIENSLDAGATSMIINIEDSGKKLIRVKDNGEGMDEEDARNSVLRHATSKIQNEDDLFAIQTLGFRGEALASIAAVSHFSIITKQKQALEGFILEIEGGAVTKSGITSSETGTTIEVRNLFFNTPARKKFMKTETVELRHIIDIVTHYALLHHLTSFKLFHGNHQLLNAPSVQNPRDNIAAMYGIKCAQDLLEVSYKNEVISIAGFISTPYHVRNDKQQQTLFVNNRWIRNEDIARAIYEAYHSLLFVNKHPVFILHLTLNPHQVDVNVHPQKSEIKIEQKEVVCAAIYKAIRETLEKNNLIPTVDSAFETQQFLYQNTKKLQGKKEEKYPFEKSKQSVFEIRESESAAKADKEKKETAEVILRTETEMNIPKNRFPAMKLLGQIHKTFFIAETEGGAYFIDQHAAHERVLYEQFIEQFMAKNVEVQYLLQGEILEVTPTEKITIEEFKDYLKQFGFEMQPFGELTYVLKSIPSLFGKVQSKEIIHEVLALLKEGREKINEKKEEIVTRMACRAAVMAGENLTNLEMDVILKDLAYTKLPYTCPHGRPTLFKITVDELEKKFRRKG